MITSPSWYLTVQDMYSHLLINLLDLAEHHQWDSLLSSSTSPPWSQSKPVSPRNVDSDEDSVSICSSASATTPKSTSHFKGFSIPDTWLPSIMAAIEAPTNEENCPRFML